MHGYFVLVCLKLTLTHGFIHMILFRELELLQKLYLG
jgi:hypothetical protein